MQVALLTKFIYLAKCLQDMHNYATCIAIVDGLDNLIVRQLPVKTLEISTVNKNTCFYPTEH